MKILSLFDGISCGRLALERAGVKVDKYYASEIDKYVTKISEKNYPDIIRLGDINNRRNRDIEEVDMIIGGSPCQGFSLVGKQLAFDDPRSKLFFTMVDIINHYKPKYFLLENVKMKKEFQNLISEYMGVKPIEINSALVSGQNRKRLYRTNIPGINQPEDKGILLKDILQPPAEIDERMIVQGKSYALTASYNGAVEWNSVEKKQRNMVRVGQIGNGGQGERIYSEDGKSVALSSLGGGGGAKTGLYSVSAHIGQRPKGYNKGGEHHEKSLALSSNSWQENNELHIVATQLGQSKKFGNASGSKKGYTIKSNTGHGVIISGNIVRKLTPIECERLQTLPDGYTEGISNTQRYKALGNGRTVDVISHIFSFIPNK